jgi:hypothetical protein
MRIMGLNAIACLVAAIAMYAVGALIYGVLFSDLWMTLSGYSPDMLAPHMWRVTLSPVMPILGAIGIALAIQWRKAEGPIAGAATGALVCLFFSLAARLYMFVYGVEPAGLLALDAAHLFATHIVGGAILGAMK